jgi:hypothetical protein
MQLHVPTKVQAGLSAARAYASSAGHCQSGSLLHIYSTDRLLALLLPSAVQPPVVTSELVVVGGTGQVGTAQLPRFQISVAMSA